MAIRNTSKKAPKIVSTSRRAKRIDPKMVATALGAERIYEFEYVVLGCGWINGESTMKERLQGTVKDTGFTLNWAAKGIGFGQLTFIRKGKKTICETETMSKEFIKQAVAFWLETLQYKDV